MSLSRLLYRVPGLALLLLLQAFPLHAQLDSLPNLFPAWYTTPDVTHYKAGGLTVSPFVNPYIPLSPLNRYRLAHPVAAGVGVTVDLSKSSALRASYSFNRGDYPGEHYTNPVHHFSRHTVSLDHLWNLSNHYYGFNPGRSWEWLLVTGGSYGWAVADQNLGATQQYYQGQIGIQVRKTLSPHVSAFLEPNYYIAGGNYDFYRNGADFDDGVSIKAGLDFRLTAPLRQTPWFDHLYASSLSSDAFSAMLQQNTSFYVQNLLGLNFSQIAHWPQDNKVLSNYSFNVAVGQWFNPAWGYRVGFVDRQILPDGQESDDKKDYALKTYRQTFARLEGVLNVPAFFDNVSFGRVGVDLSGGIEYGTDRQYGKQHKWNQTTSLDNQESYLGITAALQLKYYLNNYTAFVGEGRYVFFDRRDRVFTPALGIEYYHSSFSRYSGKNRSNSLRDLSSILPGSWFFELAVGFSKISNQANSREHVAAMTEFGMGYNINSFAALRLKEHLIDHPTVGKRRGSLHSELSLDYLFDLTNLWMGVNPARRFALRPFIGPVYSVRGVSSDKDAIAKHRFGVNYGLQHQLFINPNFAFTFEPRYLALVNDHNEWSCSAGLACVIPSEAHQTNRNAKNPRTKNAAAKVSRHYLQFIGGDQLGQAYRWTTDQFHGNFDITYGYSFVRHLAFQSSLFYQNLLVDKAHDEVDNLVGLRLEMVADLLGVMLPQAEERGYAVTAQLGADLAWSELYNTHLGPTIAMQFRRRLGQSPVWFTLQPRMQVYSTHGPNSAFTLSAGLHIAL